MPVAQRLGTAPDGRPILTKLAPPGPDADALAREAELLRRAAHPGVAEVVDAGPLPDGGFRLDTRVAGTRTLAGFRPPVEEAAGIVAALAATVADLHSIGVVHGAVEAGHVVLDARGAPVLCGFGRASRSGPVAPATDVAGLGEVLAGLVGDAAAVEPIPERRFGRRGSWSEGIARRSLLNLADQARADDPGVRPPARAFAGAVLAAVPGARLPGGGVVAPDRAAGSPFFGDRPGAFPGESPKNERGRPEDGAPRSEESQRAAAPARVARIAAAVAGLGLVAYGVSVTLGPAGRPLPSALPDPTAAASTTGPDVPAGETLRLLDCPSLSEVGADPDGDGCLSPVAVDGGVVEVDGIRYGVGEPGDTLAVGDWDCDGAATVAAVRPATGEVFVFGGWAAPGDDLVVAAASVVEGAAEARAEDPDGDGCPTLVVHTGDGHRAEVAT